MLFDPFEEEFDLPAVTIETGDTQGWDREVVGQEHQLLIGFGRTEADSAQGHRIEQRTLWASEDDGLIAANTRGAIAWMPRAAGEAPVCFCRDQTASQIKMQHEIARECGVT